MLNEIYEGLCSRCDGKIELSVTGVSGAGKTAFIRAFGQSLLPDSQTDEEGILRGSVSVGGKNCPVSLQECSPLKAQGQMSVLVTSDGSFGKSRAEIIAEEESVAETLKNSGKPFVIAVNSVSPQTEECVLLLSSLREKYGAEAVALDCMNGGISEEILSVLLMSFPVVRMDFVFPEWIRVLPSDSNLVSETIGRIREISTKIVKMSDCDLLQNAFSEGDICFESYEADVSKGVILCNLSAKEGLYYRVLSEECGTDVSDELRLMSYVRSLKESKEFFERYGAAFRTADECGYGISVPNESEMKLLSPELYHRGTKCGVSLRAEAFSYHIIKVGLQSEVSPITGETARSEEIAESMIETYKDNPEALWNTELFGKTLKDMLKEGFSEKTVPEEARSKLQKAVTRIVNEGKGGVLCVLL